MTYGTTPSPRHGFNLDLGDDALNTRLNTGLEAVEELLITELSRGASFLTDKVTHLAKAGGKRFRPMMALLASEYGPRPGCKEVVKAATVVEMGTSSPGEIAVLADIATPNVRCVVNVGPAHLEELGGLEGVAREKGALLFTARSGDVCLINRERVDWRFSHRGRGSATTHDQMEMKVGATATVVRVGITDFAQDALGDVVFVQLPEEGSAVESGESFAEVESTKSVSDIFGPLAGTVSAMNDALDASPELVNSDPYGEGWLVEIEAADEATLDEHLGEVLDAAGYRAVIEG